MNGWIAALRFAQRFEHCADPRQPGLRSLPAARRGARRVPLASDQVEQRFSRVGVRIDFTIR